MVSRAKIGLTLFALGGLTLAANAALRLTVNGAPSAAPAITVNGKVYVPLDALTKAGWKATRTAASLTLNAPGVTPPTAAAAGGSLERASVEGCLNQTLFDGVWRLTVKGIAPIMRGETVPGWGVTVELKNGSGTTVYASQTGVNGFSLIMPDGNSLEKDSYIEGNFLGQDLNAGAGATLQLKFFFPPNTVNPPRPAKLLLEVDPTRLAGFLKGKVGYTTASPSFRVDLTCTK